jgi:Flp pilus assembly protein TadD
VIPAPWGPLHLNHDVFTVVYDITAMLLIVKVQQAVSVWRKLPARAITALFILLVMAACSTTRTITTPSPPPLHSYGPRVHVDDVDVLAVSPEMKAFVRRYVMKYDNRQTRLSLLVNAVSRIGALGFDYDESSTLTASEAFAARSGNCIGFSNMMVALARLSGLDAYYQEIIRESEWTSHNDTVMQIKHVNVIVKIAGYSYVVDVSGLDISRTAPRRIVDDAYAKALYLNNLAVEALLDNDLRTAHAYLTRAIETQPMTTDSWINLGVVLGRNSQLDDAESVLKTALEINASEYSALSNLYEIYLVQEDFESASLVQARVDDYRKRNPYYLLKLSEEAIEEARFEEAVQLMERAVRKEKDNHRFYFALAKSQYLSGEREDAEGSLVRARELAPESIVAYYERPLDELVIEE